MPTMEITTMVGCPLMCTFCPQDLLKKQYGKDSEKYLSLANYKSMLAKIPNHVRIDFSGMAEPWANDDATDMLEHTLERGYRIAIYTTLYGITVPDSERIVALILRHADQVMDLCLHLPDIHMNMRGFKSSEEYRQVLRNFLQLGTTERFPSHRFSVMTMDKSGDIHPDLLDIVEGAPAWKGHSRAGNLTEQTIDTIGAMPPPRNNFALGCSVTPFYDHNVLLPNGDVVLCCMDYGKKHVIGNLMLMDYYDLYASEGLGKVRALNQQKEFTDCSLCKSCERVIEYQDNDQNALWERVRKIPKASSPPSVEVAAKIPLRRKVKRRIKDLFALK